MAVPTLRRLAVASVVLPVLVFASGCYLGWRSTVHDARAELERDLTVAEVQATRVFDTQLLVAGRVSDLIDDLSDEQIVARESELRAKINALIKRYPQIDGVLLIGSKGQGLLATAVDPLPPGVSFTDRGYYRALKESKREFYIGGTITARFSHHELFTISRRKGDDPTRLDGVISITVSPRYFQAFGEQLFNGDTDYSAALFRDDGTGLARFPPLPGALSIPARGVLLTEAMKQSRDGGMVSGRTASDGVERLFAYRRLPDYPVYVTVSRTWSSIVRQWRDLMLTHLIFGVPATLALFALSLVALRRARREHEAMDQLADHVQRLQVAEEALRQAQKMEAVGRLTGGIAHDVNNHLTVISSNIELLGRRLPPGTESLRRLLDGAMQGVQRAATLTHRLLAFSRQQPLDPEPLELGRLVSGMSDLLRRTLGGDVVIETVLAGGLWLTRVDANQLENALLNLAVNARDAMPQGGKLTIETANAHLDESYAAAHAEVAAGQYVMLAVSDTGTGMSPEVVAKVFEPFFTTKPVGQGTGLGLSMVYGFVKQSGGHVKIYSELGEGTVVKLYLPRFVNEASKAAKTARAIQVAVPRGSGQLILLVEDDEGVRTANADALRDLGYRVLQAGDAMTALSIINDRKDIDLLFTDVGLPGGMNGRVLAEAAHNVRPDLRVLFTTGYTRNAIIHNGMLDPGVHFIAKPFGLDALAAKLRDVLTEPASA